MQVTGGCQCGAIRYEADVDPTTSTVCHCNDCQKFSGSGWRTSVRTRAADFRLTGIPSVYIKTAESGTKRGQAFCPDCGSALYAFTPPDPQIISIRVGGIDQRADLPPQAQIWCEAALPWALDISGLPGHAKQ